MNIHGTAMRLRRRIDPKTFVITLRQVAKFLKITQERILNWEKWHNVLWVHIKGIGGYFVSYRQLEQWIATSRTLIRFCSSLSTLNELWRSILQEEERYAEDAIARLKTMYQQRYADLSLRQQM
jgi:hypothetical protein